MSHPVARSRSLRRFAVVCTAALLLGASACSSDAKDGSSGDGATTTTVAGFDPSTTLAPIDPDDIAGGEEAYVEALVPLISQGAGLDQEGADKASECLAPRWVEIIGVEGFAKAGLAPEDLEDLSGGLEILKVDREQAEEMVAEFAECDIDLRETTLAQLVASGQLSEEAQACVDEVLTNELLEQSLIDALIGEVDRNGAFSAIEGCARQPGATGDGGEGGQTGGGGQPTGSEPAGSEPADG